MNIIEINNEIYWCCPHCDAELMSDTANSTKTASGTYVFFDGDTIQADTSSHPIFTDHNFLSSLDVGKCSECSKHFSSINIKFMNSNLPEAIEYVWGRECCGKPTNFVICKRKDLIQSDVYKNFEYFILSTFDTLLGTLYDMRLCILPLTPNETKDLLGIHGVLSCGDSDVWDDSTSIVEEFLYNHHDLIENMLCHGIAKNMTEKTDSVFAQEESICQNSTKFN